MANVKNRKKELKNELKRQGIIGKEHPRVVTLENNTDITAIPADAVSITEKPSLSEFTESPELDGVRSNAAEGLYEEDITSTDEIKDMNEEELLEAKNVGPVTVGELSKSVGIDGKLSLEEFAALPELDGIRSDLVETLFQEGITSLEDFATWTKEALIDINGIGAGTVDKLVENGVSLKK